MALIHEVEESEHDFGRRCLHEFGQLLVPGVTLERRSSLGGDLALHPLRVVSVAWVAERKDVLSGLFFVLTLLAYEPELDADNRFALHTNGDILPLRSSEIAALLARGSKP